MAAVHLVTDEEGGELLLLEFQGRLEASASELRLVTLGQLDTSAVAPQGQHYNVCDLG